MALVVVGSYVVRFPLGGYLSWVLQWLVGFQRLGHDVYFVEKSAWANACYDPSQDVMSDDYSYGLATVGALLSRFDLQDKLCFVDVSGHYHGLPRERVEAIFKSADLFVDMGTHGSWLPEAGAGACLRILVDGDPGYTQMRAIVEDEGDLGEYDYYYSVGQDVGTDRSMVPAMGKQWHHIFDPVVLDLFPLQPVCPEAAFTTVMAWQSYRPIEFEGVEYGSKDREFIKFMDLPSRTSVPLELAVGGEYVPTEELLEAGWRLRDPLATTVSFDSFRDYLAASRGEFSVCKNFYVATRSGFFSERSAAYLASGRPVVMQETGFSAHLPCGRGLFAVKTVEEAVAAIEEIDGNYECHSRAAREIAAEYLSTSKVLGKFLNELALE